MADSTTNTDVVGTRHLRRQQIKNEGSTSSHSQDVSQNEKVFVKTRSRQQAVQGKELTLTTALPQGEPRAKMSITPVKQHISKQQAVGMVTRRSLLSDNAPACNDGVGHKEGNSSRKSDSADTSKSELGQEREKSHMDKAPKMSRRSPVSDLTCSLLKDAADSVCDSLETLSEASVSSADTRVSSTQKTRRRRKFGTYSLLPRKRKRKQGPVGDDNDGDNQGKNDSLSLKQEVSVGGELCLDDVSVYTEDSLKNTPMDCELMLRLDSVTESSLSSTPVQGTGGNLDKFGVTSTPIQKSFSQVASPVRVSPGDSSVNDGPGAGGGGGGDGEVLNDEEYRSLLKSSGIMVARKCMSLQQPDQVTRLDLPEEDDSNDTNVDNSSDPNSPRRSGREKKPKTISADFANSQTVCLLGKGAGIDRVLRPKETGTSPSVEHAYSQEKPKVVNSSITNESAPTPPRKPPIAILVKHPGTDNPMLLFRTTNSKELRLPSFTKSLLPPEFVAKKLDSNSNIVAYPLSSVAKLGHRRRQELLNSVVPMAISSSSGTMIFRKPSADSQLPGWAESILGNSMPIESSSDGKSFQRPPPGGTIIGNHSKRSKLFATVSKVRKTAELDRGAVPLCCCKVEGAPYADLTKTQYCQALDTIDGKVSACSNSITNPLLARASVKLPFIAVCEVHRLRLKIHQCCPGCGRFCSQGSFYQCRKNMGHSALSVHHYHIGCEVVLGEESVKCCPHCGDVSQGNEVNLQMNATYSHNKSQLDHFKRATEEHVRARISFGKTDATSPTKVNTPSPPTEPAVTVAFPESNCEISSDGLPLGMDRNQLEEMLRVLQEESDSKDDSIDGKPRKLRPSRMLYSQVKKGNLRNVLSLLKDGADPNLKFDEHDHETPVHAAAKIGHLPILHCLISAGASVHVMDDDLWTPVMFAVEKNHTHVIKYLVKAGADVTTKAQDGLTPLHIACREGYLELVKLFLDDGKYDVNLRDKGGWTPIIWASEHNHIEVVQYLLSQGADPNLRDDEQNTGLHWAAFSGSVDIAEMYFKHGSDVDVVNERGDRPLHIAARQDHYDCVMLFLARGAKTTCRNNEGKLPIECCTSKEPGCFTALKLAHNLQKAQGNNSQIEKVLHRDISYGRESSPIPCVNGVDDEPMPQDYRYVTENVQTSQLHINTLVSSLQSCLCRNVCSTSVCVCTRNSIKCWYTKEGTLVEDFPYIEPPLIFECNKACQCWMTCENRVIQRGITARMQLFKTVGRGWGLRALLDIPKGAFVCEYIGELISDQEADRREDDSYLFDLDNRDGETFCIDARSYGNVSRFINHLCEPNLVPVKVYVDHQDLRFPRICLFASRDVKAGEELGFDYGEKFWVIKWKFFTCECGSSKCKFSRDTIHQTIADYKKRQDSVPAQ